MSVLLLTKSFVRYYMRKFENGPFWPTRMYTQPCLYRRSVVMRMSVLLVYVSDVVCSMVFACQTL